MTSEGPLVSVAVEGRSDTGMAQAVISHTGFTLARPIIVRDGVANLDHLIPDLARTGPHAPWVVFRDADRACPVDLRRRLIGERQHGDGFELRIACSMTEAWLLADGDGLAQFFRVKRSRIPSEPDQLSHAKRELLHLCQSSRARSIKEAMVRNDGTPGPLYVTTVNEFATHSWSIDAAQKRSPSLGRTIKRLGELRDQLTVSG